MTNQIYDDIALERIAKEKFGLDIEIRQTIAPNIPISHTGTASVFMTTKKHLFAYISAQSKITLADVTKIVGRMGLKAELYVPPRGQPDYFGEIGRSKFRQVYPGRTNINDDDIRFYKTLAPYNPALVQIKEVKDGEIKQFDVDASGNWRVAAKFAYRRITTS